MMAEMAKAEGAQADRRFGIDAEGAEALLAEFGSPLYVYDEGILRLSCREVAAILSGLKYHPSYSLKANGNPALLAIIAEEGFYADAMSPGEILLLERAAFDRDRILFVPNNVGRGEFAFALERGILCSVDSIAQLELFAREFPGERIALRMNPGIGDGHHEKVVTGGRHSKFGILPEEGARAMDIIAAAKLRLMGLNQHIGSGFMAPDRYIESAAVLCELRAAMGAGGFLDFGGGFGIPYRKAAGEARLDLAALGTGLRSLISNRALEGTEVRVEPGRYPVAECGFLLGRVHAVKEREGTFYAGTDLGQNVLARPVLYGAYHEVEILGPGIAARGRRKVSVVGNICESGDFLARDRELPEPREGDIVLVRDAGAYGWSMASSYNARPRPAEVLIGPDGKARLIRRRETIEDILGLLPENAGREKAPSTTVNVVPHAAINAVPHDHMRAERGSAQ